MKYRHSFHAGNFADVHKHVTLLALIAALQLKGKGFLYLETHAGRGMYDLGAGDVHAGGPQEAHHGINALRAAHCHSPEIIAYLAAVTRTQGPGGAHSYPGSPLLAAAALRAQDRGVCCELQPPECRALERALRDYPYMRCLATDGYAALNAHLPPLERRALVLIDPPYEESSKDFARGLSAVTQVLARLANAVVVLWYPIKDQRDLAPWLTRVAGELTAPTLNSQLWVHPLDSRVALNGSGLLLINPPFQFDAAAQRWLPELGRALGEAASGAKGTALNWLVHGH